MLIDLNSQFYTLILGALLMLGLYHLLIFIKNRKNIYLYYGLYVFALSVYLVERLPNDPLNIHYINPSIQFLIFALYVQFARNLLETKGKNIMVDRYFKVFYKYLYGLSMACLILYFISNDFLLKIYFYIIPFFILLCVFVYWQIFKIEGAVVKYFIIGSLFYFLLTVASFIFTPTTGLIQESWIFKKGFHPLFFMYVGVMIENIVFAILVGQKAKDIEVENAIFQKNIVIEKQKNLNLLKQQEIISINAMVEGQEKERQRIANDLHDDLGSLMANIKMHFGTFKTKDSDNLFRRTNDLIEEAYQKIRNLAHAKNSGVLARQGLYEAIKRHANSISVTKEIKINIMENGLNQRLENSLELTIFRIVQELITNTIKHAQAKELDIHLNQHENVLNIMVEDDGIGFDNTKPRKEQSGIGLSSIERRVEDLGGSVIIESQPGSGTSVIIDIPVV